MRVGNGPPLPLDQQLCRGGEPTLFFVILLLLVRGRCIHVDYDLSHRAHQHSLTTAQKLIYVLEGFGHFTGHLYVWLLYSSRLLGLLGQNHDWVDQWKSEFLLWDSERQSLSNIWHDYLHEDVFALYAKCAVYRVGVVILTSRRFGDGINLIDWINF